MSDFIFVKKTRRTKSSPVAKIKDKLPNPRKIPNVDDPAALIEKILRVKEELINTEYFKNSVKLLDKSLVELDNRLITEILCLGLGNFSDCSSALHQLAFLIGINEKYQQHAKPIRIYDPVFTNCEKSILIQLQFEIILENLEGKHPAEDLTLFYFPHCLKELSNNLLWKNWSPKLLENVILISNSFKSIVDAIPTRLLKLNANYLLDIQQFVEEKELKNSNSLYKFFNDLSIHTFPRKIFEIIPAVLWEQNEEPVYIDLDDEFVRQEVNENGSSENSSCPA